MTKLRDRLLRLSKEKRRLIVETLARECAKESDWQRLVKMLTDIEFLEVKAEEGLVFGLADDLQEAARVLPRGQPYRQVLALLGQAVRRDVHFVDRHPTALFQSLWNSCWWYDCSEAAEHYRVPEGGWPEEGPPWKGDGLKLCHLLEQWRRQKEQDSPGFSWMRSLRPPPTPLGSAEAAICSGHTESVCSVRFSPDGRHLVTASYDRTVRLWEVGTGRELACAAVADGSPLVVGFTHTGEPVWVAAHRDRTIRVNGVKTGRERACLRGHQEVVECMAISDDGEYVVAGSRDQTIRAWRADTGEEVAALTMEHFAKPETNNPRETYVLDAQARLHRLSQSGMGSTSGKGFRADLDRVAGLLSDFRARVLNRPRTLGGQNAWQRVTVGAVAVSFNGHRLAYTASDGVVRVFDVRSAREVGCWGGVHGVCALASTSDGEKVLCGSLAGIRGFEVGREQPFVEIVNDPPEGVACLALSAEDRLLACGYGNGEVRLWNLATRNQEALYRYHTHRVECVAISPYGRTVASGSEDTTVRICQAEQDVVPLLARGHVGRITGMAITSSGEKYATASYEDHTIRLWDASSGRELACLSGHEGSIERLLFFPDGSRLLSCSDDRTIRMWDAGSGKEILCLKGHERGVGCIDLSECGGWVASGSADGTVRVWNVASGKELACLKGHREPVESVAFSPDGMLIASGGMDGTVRFWRVGHRGTVACIVDRAGSSLGAPYLRFLSNWRRIAILWPDDTVRVWNIQDGCEEGCLAPGCIVRQFAVTEGGGLIIAGCEGNEVRVWDAASLRLVQRFEGLCLGCGDIEAIAKGPTVFPWRAVPKDLETAIESVREREAVAYVPCRSLTLLPTGRVWAGTEGRFLYSFTLEGKAGHSDAEGDDGVVLPMAFSSQDENLGRAELYMKRTVKWRSVLRQLVECRDSEETRGPLSIP